MKIKGIKEVFNDYKKTSLLIATNLCDFKCEKENLCSYGLCQNSELTKEKTIEVSTTCIIEIYNKNTIVNAIVVGGLEPFLQFEEVYEFIKEFRKQFQDDIVIYTGYYPEEIKEQIQELKEFTNIIIKFGRYIQDSKPIYSEVLGITLASENQFAKRIEYLT
jgi:pyruvate-formate lyase-activating enzyme